MNQVAQLEVRPEKGASAALTLTSDVLRLIGSGAGGPILLALGPGPLRTQQLTDRLSHLSPRSAYRHIGNLREHGLLTRQVEAGVPSRVVLGLTDPQGRSLCRLLRSFVESTMSKLPRRGDGAAPWEALGLLGDLWELGLIDELSRGPKTVIELAKKSHPMTYHQVNRRAGLLATYGLANSYSSSGNSKCYELTDDGRRCMGLVCGIGRWRQRYVLEDGDQGLSTREMATILRTVLPVIDLREFAGMSLDLEVSECVNGDGCRASEVLQGSVDRDGTMRFGREPKQTPDGLAAATINTWFGVLLDGNRGRVKVRGDLKLVDACLTQLYEVLWDQSQPAALSAS